MDYKRIIWEGHHHRFGLAGEGQADTIQEFLEQHPGTALNVGCGPWGAKLQALAPHCRSLIALDRAIEAIRHAAAVTSGPNIRLLVADAHHLPFCDCAFDHVLALGLFAHISTPRPVFRELQRVCRTGGHVFVTNAVRHPPARYERAAARAGLERVHAEEGYCPAASGDVKRRYLLVFQRRPHESSSRDVGQ